jgi:hypothetical protein
MVNGMLGGAEQQVRPGIGSAPARQRGNAGDVTVIPDPARGGDAVPPAASRPGGSG